MKFRNQLVVSACATLALLNVDSQAGPFTYNPQDLLVGFRNAAGANDFVVDIGAASLYYNAAPGTFAVGGFAGAQLTSAFGSLDGLSFSVFGDVRTTGNAAHPQNTLWLTRVWTDSVTPSDPWNRASTFSQGNPASRIDGIANGAVTYSSTIGADPNNNTATAVLIPKTWNGGGVSYTIGVGPIGNLGGTFQGSIENTTPAGFSGSGLSIRSDLYELNPGTGPGTYLGYFQLNAAGTLTFTAVPEPGAFAFIGMGFAALLILNRSGKRVHFRKSF
jgi:hypothetical protein